MKPEEIAIPFSKSSGREGSIRIAEGPDGKFRIGLNISKKYGDFEGSGYAPAIDGTAYDTREEAIKAGIETIRGRTKGDDPKSKAALKELAAFEMANVSTPAKIVDPEPTSGVSPAEQEGQGVAETPEIKAAGTGGARGPKPKKDSQGARTEEGRETSPFFGRDKGQRGRG